ncbi:hypothetical protein FALBO_5895 [Fusarium albosuccineum]|uniref:DUF6594 domain-containing protein n=1 Tax=Fusarium albosuccineum TaxID=1237068 RepID=A0A8H4PF43_9HYPO|nr:hypothetical protein FALBO_5895 [Fusarium albosuccineum]
MSRTYDIEQHADKNPQPHLLGFAALSSWMASDGDQELLVFRRFDEISARNLLYLQCELIALEEKLTNWDRAVSSKHDTALEQGAETWEIMVEQAQDGRPEAKDMMELVSQVRAEIKEYHEALNLQSKVARLHSPDKRALKVARNELHGGPLTEDGFKPSPMAVRAHWPGKEEVSRDGLSRISRFDERLYFVSSPAAVLGMICTFTIAFALSVGLMTNAKRAEIFAGSAAYAAVLVVFTFH